MGQTAFAEAHVASSADEAFERLYREHAPTVYRYALGVLRNPADAEDLTQTTFTNAYRAVRGGEWPSKPENWLITIAHNECRQRFRRQGRRAIEVPFDEEVAERSRFAEPAETAEEVEGVLNALAELPFNQRAALVLREVSGRSAAEIAEFLGTSVNAVDMLLFRARRTLRTHYSAVKTLALVPLPRSLLSFRGGSAAASAGAAAGGLGVAGKVAALLAAGAVATGGGYTGLMVKEHRDDSPPARPAAKPPVRAQRGPVQGVPGSREVPPAIREAPAAEQPVGDGGPLAGTLPAAGEEPTVVVPPSEPSAVEPPVTIPSSPAPPVLQPPAVTPPSQVDPPALPPLETPPAPPPVEPPAVTPAPLPPILVEPPAVTVPPLVPEIPTLPVGLPGP